MNASLRPRLVRSAGAGLQAGAHAAASAPLLAEEHVVGSVLAVFVVLGVWASLRLLLVDSIEVRAVVVTLGGLTVLGVGLAVTLGFPGSAVVPVTPGAVAVAAASVLAGIAMLPPHGEPVLPMKESAPYHQ